MSQRLTDMALTRVSVVDKGANARRFAVLKRGEEDPMNDTVDAPDGVIAWLRKALGLDSPVTKGAMPTTDAAMRSHLSAKTPSGHGMGDIAIADMSMDAMGKKHTGLHGAGADHSHADTVAKTGTFAAVVAGQELRDALYDSWYTLEDVLWSAIYAYDADGQALSLEAKKALVAQDLDEFKSYLLSQMDGGIQKRDGGPAEAATRHIAAVVAKAGKKLSGARLERLQTASEALNSVLAEVAEVTEEAGAEPQEDNVEKAELIAAITEANEPIVKRLEAIEKSAAASAPAAGEPVEEPATLDTVVEVVGKLADRLEAIEKTRGERTSVAGQDNSEPVKKSKWAGVF